MASISKSKYISINRILVPIDFSVYSENALKLAVILAKSFKAQIDLIHVVTPVYVGINDADLLPSNDMFYFRLLKASESNLNKMAKKIIGNNPIKVNSKSYLDIVHRAILNHSRKAKTDLIVMGTHGTSGFMEFFSGSNAFRVVSETNCPVITLQNKVVKHPFKTVVIPAINNKDFTETVKFVEPFAKELGLKLVILTFQKNGNTKQEFALNKLVTETEAELNKQHIHTRITSVKNENITKSVISYCKKNKTDLIAIAATKKFSINHLLTGSYAQQFVNHSNIPVLSIPGKR